MVIFDKISYSEFRVKFPVKSRFPIFDTILDNFFRFIAYAACFWFVLTIVSLFIKLPLSSYLLHIIVSSCILGIVMTAIMAKRFKKLENYGPDGIISTIHVKTNNAVLRPGVDDYSDSLYLDIIQDGQPRVFFMNGLYLVELLDTNELPNTEFVIYQEQDTLDIIKVKTIGTYFRPQRTLAAFSESELTNFEMPADLTVLDETIDNIQ